MRSTAAMYPSQYRDYVKTWNRYYQTDPEFFNESGFERLAKLARKSGGSFKEQRGIIFRVMFPFVVPPRLPEHMAVMFKSAGYTVNLLLGTVTDNHGREAKLAKSYQQLCRINNAPHNIVQSSLELWSSSVAVSGSFILVVSRHPYDIAGMSTGRGWVSCHTVGGLSPNAKRKFLRDRDNAEKNKAVDVRLHREYATKYAALMGLSETDRAALEARLSGEFYAAAEAAKFLLPKLRAAMLGLVDTADLPAAKKRDLALKVSRFLDKAGNNLLYDSTLRRFVTLTGNSNSLDRVVRTLQRDICVDMKQNTLAEYPQQDLFELLETSVRRSSIQEAFNDVMSEINVNSIVANVFRELPQKPDYIGTVSVDDYVEEHGTEASLVYNDIKQASVICYVIRPNAKVVESLTTAQRIVPGFAAKLDAALNKSNKDPLFDPILRVILRLTGNRYYRVGAPYGSVSKSKYYVPQVRSFSQAAAKISMLLNRSRKRTQKFITDTAAFDPDTDKTYEEYNLDFPEPVVRRSTSVSPLSDPLEFSALDKYVEYKYVDDDADSEDAVDGIYDTKVTDVYDYIRQKIAQFLNQETVGKFRGRNNMFGKSGRYKVHVAAAALNELASMVDSIISTKFDAKTFADAVARKGAADAVVKTAVELLRVFCAKLKKPGLSRSNAVNRLLVLDSLYKIGNGVSVSGSGLFSALDFSAEFLQLWSNTTVRSNTTAVNQLKWTSILSPRKVATVREALRIALWADEAYQLMTEIRAFGAGNSSIDVSCAFLKARSVSPLAVRWLRNNIPKDVPPQDYVTLCSYFFQFALAYGSTRATRELLDKVSTEIDSDIAHGIPGSARVVLDNIRKEM